MSNIQSDNYFGPESKARYCPPFGDDIKDADFSEIRNVVFDKNEDYWLKGSGESGIELDGIPDRLVFFNYRNIGFFIMISPDYEVPVLEQTESCKTYSHNIGGNEFRFPSCCLFDKESTMKIIQHFITTGGGKLEDCKWIELYDLEFEHEF